MIQQKLKGSTLLPSRNTLCESARSTRCFIAATALLALVVVTCLWPVGVQGQVGGESWSPSLQFGVPNETSAFPVLVPDASGGVHLFWVGSPSTDDSVANQVYYHRYWDGKDWSHPVDILAAPDGGGFESMHTSGGPSVVLDPHGWLHITWISTKGNLYYTSAPANQADSVQSWSTPRILAFAFGTTAIISGQDGTVHLLYDRDADYPGVSYIQSTDGGEIWSEPTDVSGGIGFDQTTLSVRMVIDGRGWLHAGWHYRQIGPDTSFFDGNYARSEDGGRTWTKPMSVGIEPVFVNLAVDSQDNIHLFWLGLGGQRFHQWSPNGGDTWTNPEAIFSGLTGRFNGWVAVAVDSAGTLHAVTGAGNFGSWYSRWNGRTWTKPVVVDPVSEPGRDPHFPSLAITEGNQLHLARHVLLPTTVLYSSLRLSAPYVQPQLLMTPLVRPTVQVILIVTPTFTLSPNGTPVAQFNKNDASPGSDAGSNSAFGVMAGVVPAILFVSLVILVLIMRGGRRLWP